MTPLRMILAAGLVGLASPATLAGESLRGTAHVIDGGRMIVAGRKIELADIAVPQLGTQCSLRGKLLDCGRLARAGLMDITAGAEVVCYKTGAGSHRCTADGYDLSYGQLHAGWAVTIGDAPASYAKKMAEAKRRQRGLWRATGADSRTAFLSQLTR